MSSEDQTPPNHTQILEAARLREIAWITEAPEERTPLVKQFPSPVRPYQDLWHDSPPSGTKIPAYPPCPRCQKLKLDFLRVVDEVRHSGDAYGTAYQSCRRCGWTCWWRFDDAS